MEATRKADATRLALLEVGHAPTELVLTRLCADVSKILYQLRLNGDRVGKDLLHAHDSSLRASLDAILGGGLTDEAWEQATMGVDMSGIGFREAKLSAPIAFVASRIAARPMVKTLAQHVASVGLATVDVQMRLFDERTDAAMEMITGGIDRDTANELLRVAVDKSDAVAAMWDGLFVDEPGGEAMEASAALAGPPRPRRPGDSHHLLPDDADGDDEHPDANALPTALAIQKALFRITDARRNALIRHSMLRRGDLPGVRRLDELQHAECDHTWMWTLSRHKGKPLAPDDFIDALRIRLGIAGPCELLPCELCGAELMDAAGAHALCCARAESTRGHHGVARTLFDEVAIVDPAAELEAPGLIPGTLLRPADVLTSAAGAGLTALDIGIASPDAANAGNDCVVSMYGRKEAYYAEYEPALACQNVVYQPMVFSCYGRPHPRTTAILRTLAKRLSRRRGCASAEWRYRRLRARLASSLWTRAARMVRACWAGRGGHDEATDEPEDADDPGEAIPPPGPSTQDHG